MRFAPPNPLRIADRAGGLNAPSVRGYNERLVLSLLLQSVGMSRLEITERTGLSAQTVSVIVRSLEQEGLVAKGEAQRGRVGPPTIPMTLNPDGAYSIGVSFGAHAVDVVLINFVGDVRFHALHPYSEGPSSLQSLYPRIGQALDVIPQPMRSRIAGIGLAVPEDPSGNANVATLVGGDFVEEQRHIELKFDLPVFVQNDITAAAGGESLFGAARSLSDLVFFYLGSRLHSRLILNHQIYQGAAGAGQDVGLARLRDVLAGHGPSVDAIAGPAAFNNDDTEFAVWLQQCRRTIIDAVAALQRFVPVRSVVLSSYAPVALCDRIKADLASELPGVDVLLGRNSTSPKAVGAASLPYQSRFMVQ